jgi:PAS domain S-box-containing protein
MERKRLDEEPEAETPPPHLRRATSMPASMSPPAQGRHAREGASDPSAGQDREHSSWIGAGLAMKLPPEVRDLLKRYGLAMALAGLALLIRGVLPFKEGTAIYQLPIAAVVLSAWYGGRGPGLFASLICITGSSYWFVPPVNSFATSPDHMLPFSIFIALCLFFTEFSAGRRRGARALRASEERFRTLVQFSFDVYWETDAEHRFTRQEFSERLTDAPAPGAEIGKTRWEIPYVEPDEEAWRKHRATLDAHLPFRDFELARPTADGGTRYVSVSGIPVFDEIGRFVGYRGVGRHITERKRAEAEHRSYLQFLESMDRIHRVMQGTNDLERMMSDVLDTVLEVFECDRAWLLYPCDPEAPSWRAVMEHTRPEFPGVFASGRDLPMTADSAEVARAALDCRRALPAGPGHERQVKPGIAERFGVRSEMLMALHPKGDQPYLFGLHQCGRPRTWTKEEKRLFEEIGHRLVDALSSLVAFRSLRESERRLEAAQQIAHVGWWERDFVAGRVSLSDEACRIFGVQPHDLPQWQERWVNLIHPDDREKTAAASAAALDGRARYDVAYRVVRPDGAVRMVHSQGDVTRDDSGRPLRQFGVMQDITTLWQAEQELRARQDMLDLAQKAARAVAFDWFIGAREAENRWSPDLEAMYGLEPGTFDRTFQGWKKLVHPDDWPSVKLALKRAQESGDVAAEYRVLHKDGTVHWLQAKGRMFFDAEGRPDRMIGFMIDVTDRRHAEEELRTKDRALETARTELARVSRLTTLGELTTSIAHEVSQPLGAMVVSAGACARWLAADPPAMAEARAALDNIVADGKRAREVIARVRALTKGQAPRKDRLDINHKIAEVLALMDHELRSHDIRLRTDLDRTLPGVAGDRVQLQQVLLNLIMNAIEAMSAVHDRSRDLTIVSRQDGSNAVLVEVRDSGNGLDPQRAERVFEAFYTTKAEGIGIGLSISRSIIEAHGGRLWASANAPYGAVFRFSLPVAEKAVS